MCFILEHFQFSRTILTRSALPDKFTATPSLLAHVLPSFLALLSPLVL